MALLAPKFAEVTLLEYMLGKSTQATAGQLLHLYSNPHTPSDDSTLSSFLQSGSLVTGTGYASVPLVSSGWSISDPTTNATVTASYTEVVFSFTTGFGTLTQAYGYFVTNSTGTALLWAELFSGGPFTMPTGGGSIAITSRVTLE